MEYKRILIHEEENSEKLAKDVGNGGIKRKVSKSDRVEEGYRANSKIEK
ncbi:hypothetical protein [Thermofilum sp.]